MTTPLTPWIRRQIEATGPVPFARFMEWALYHPDDGYYAAGRVRVGDDRGDFTTAPHLSPLFARCLARLVAAADEALDHPDPFTVVEGGPGEGRLARDLLDTLRERDPALYGRLRYSLDETSPTLRTRQQELLAPHGGRVAAGFPPAPFRGLYLSNELLDAFPVHRLVRTAEGWLEVHVTLEGDGFAEVLLPPSREDLAPCLAEEGITFPEGCRVEVCPGIGPWMERVSGGLAAGYAVTVDYGDEAARLWAGGGGTCAAYRAHRQVPDLLEAPGEQDLTAHVNFSAVRRLGASHGLKAAPLLRQRDFLFALGLVREAEELEHQLDGPELLAARQALGPLLFPGGMGDAFKALVQAKDAPLTALPLDPEGGVSR